MTAIPLLRRQVLAACDPTTAQRLWAEGIGTWWPLASFSCFGEDSSVAVDGGDIVETSAEGGRAIWGTVVSDAPGSLSFTWHPDRDPEEATQVSVVFTATGAEEDVTLVTLVHSGWQEASARSRYADGWIRVLDRFADAAAGSAGGELWFALEHTAGPATPEGGVFSSPDFRHHVAFLRSLAADGVLVAGGPLPDVPGAGMTIVRTPDAAAARRVVAAAQHDDGAVTAGLLEVLVRPWRVVLSALP